MAEPNPINIKTYSEIAQDSLKLLKHTEDTTNYYLKKHIHHKLPNIPITRMVVFGKVASVCVSIIITYIAVNRINDSMINKKNKERE